ncbi:Dyp-type peroxidase [Nocardioides insulae]|uniref:Dyp-type peroxidase n=1 Tax=Nocardioides insulae TaxID=394734 RepID=UPI0003FEB356|nr:hypothetical protein [Nocardioides insulae]
MARADLRQLLRWPRRPSARIDVDDVQALVMQGYGRLRGAAYLLLEVTDPIPARSWLAALVGEVTLGERRPVGTATNVAFTATGLGRLGVTDDVLAGFAPEYVEGMTSAHRTRLLGDAGAAAPSAWAWGGPQGPSVDVLVLLYATTAEELTGHVQEQRSRATASGLREVALLDTEDIGLGEHFGFRDGISQPVLAGTGRPSGDLHVVAPGEFLLGYPNQHGQAPSSPTVAADDDTARLLPPAKDDRDRRDLGRNGTYLVMRTLSQDVGAFWRYADAQTRRADGSSDPAARTSLAARMVGRWPSGAPLTLSPDRDRPELAEQNDFGYHEHDAEGFACPIGAHVRRTHPRDSLPPRPGSDTSVEVGKGHRLLRRGRPYGPPVDLGDALTAEEAGDVRGLHFIALCTDIARQFEFISHTWVQNPHFAGLYDDSDPLLGGHTGEGSGFTVQQRPVRRRYVETPAVVTTRGGAYFFLPGARALRYLSGG